MDDPAQHLGILRRLTWEDGLLILGILAAAGGLAAGIRAAVGRLAERAPARLRLPILRVIPLLRLAVGVAAFALVVPRLVEPTFRNVLALVAAGGLALAFAFKDFASCLVAGLVTILENVYQPGDWIEIDGAYGQVRSIGLRAVRIVTADDTEIAVPHSRLWSASVHNATGGQRSLLCVAEFHLDPDHDAETARRRLAESAEQSPLRRPDSPVVVVVSETPWGTQYRVKAYAKESREQFLFITDLTLRGRSVLQSLGARFARAPYAAGKA